MKPVTRVTARDAQHGFLHGGREEVRPTSRALSHRRKTESILAALEAPLAVIMRL